MNPRHVGVSIPQNQGALHDTPMKVNNVAELKTLLIEYTDENGRKKTTLAVAVGGKTYVWPQGEQMAAGFRSFTEALNKQVLEKLEARQPGSTGATLVVDQSVDISPEV